jgi:hypothetical protein
MVASHKGLGPEKDCAGNGQQRIQKTRPLVREGAPQNKTATVRQKYISGHEPQTELDTKTYWLTVSRNVTLTSTLSLVSQWRED